jgi:hypothetical protein
MPNLVRVSLFSIRCRHKRCTTTRQRDHNQLLRDSVRGRAWCLLSARSHNQPEYQSCRQNGQQQQRVVMSLPSWAVHNVNDRDIGPS